MRPLLEGVEGSIEKMLDSLRAKNSCHTLRRYSQRSCVCNLAEIDDFDLYLFLNYFPRFICVADSLVLFSRHQGSDSAYISYAR